MEESITEVMSNLVLQIGIILFVVRIFGKLAQKIKIPSVLGELVAGIIIGPYALGGISLPGFPAGIFPLNSASLAVSPELYAFSTVASIILLFASGLETNLTLFLKYSVAGGIIGLGGVVVSFLLGDLAGVLMLHTNIMDTRCLFLGIMSTATSVGITARILSDNKKMDSPEGVTTLAAAVFDDVLGIVLLAVILGIVSAVNTQNGTGIQGSAIAMIAVKAFGIWLVFTVLGLIFSKKIASFLKLFKHSYDFSICALGVALLLAAFFEKQGLAMIIGAYITGLSLSNTDIAAVIQERLHGLYDFFVPMFFAVMGMMVNVGEIFNKEVLIFGLIYTVLCVLSKILGCGLPTLALGFNMKGFLRIGCGMIPRGEVALIIAGIGLTAGILNEQLFGVVILMTLLTTLVAPPLLSICLNIKGRGTREEVKTAVSTSLSWDFGSSEIADLVIDTLLKDLKSDGFYVQMMNINDGLSQARKDNISLSIKEEENKVIIETNADDVGFVKTSMYEVVLRLSDLIQEMKNTCDPQALRKESAEIATGTDKNDPDVFKHLFTRSISVSLHSETKQDILKELVMLLSNSGFVTNWEQVLEDVLAREKTMSTGMQNGIAIPHAKSDGVNDICVAIGIKKDGIDFESLDGEKSKLFVLVVSPKKTSSPHLQNLASIARILKDKETTNRIVALQKPEDVMSFLISRK